MKQAIETRYLGQTNARGSRIQARCLRGKKVYPWDYTLSAEENHIKAAKSLCEHFAKEGNSEEWLNPFVSGFGPKDCGFHVFTD